MKKNISCIYEILRKWGGQFEYKYACMQQNNLKELSWFLLG